MQGEEGARRDEGRKEKKAALGPEVSFFPRGASYVFLYPLDQYILHLAFKSFTPYHSICSLDTFKFLLHLWFCIQVIKIFFQTQLWFRI